VHKASVSRKIVPLTTIALSTHVTNNVNNFSKSAVKSEFTAANNTICDIVPILDRGIDQVKWQ
jgi:hypothetical protein